MKSSVIAFVLLMCAAACNDSNTRPMPRRTAYPRTAALSDSTKHATAGHINLQLNAIAIIRTPRPDWLDAEYRPLGATLHLSATENADEASVANRRERISLNLGGATARATEFTTPSGFQCEIVTTAEGPATPVQFIALRGKTLVSGAFVLSGKTTPADSIRPITEALEREATAILNSIAEQ